MTANPDQTWIDLKDAAPLLGMTLGSARNLITLNKFPVPTYKLGRRTVVDRDVLNAFFAEQRAKGLARIKEAPAPADRRKPYNYKHPGRTHPKRA